MGDMHAGWSVCGIEEEAIFEQLLYSKAGATLVAQFRRQSALGAPVASLYVRHKAASRYVRLTELSESLSYEDPVAASQAPVLVVNLMNWTGEGTADWAGVQRIDLVRGCQLSLLRPGDLVLTPPYLDAWIKALQSSWDDGRGVVCVIAFVRPVTDADRQPFAARGAYVTAVADTWLCELDLVDHRYTKIAPLLTPFF